MPKFAETRKRAARASTPSELDAFFLILNTGRYEFAGVGVFDAEAHHTHYLVRSALTLCASAFIGWQEFDRQFDVPPQVERWLRPGRWNADGTFRGSTAKDLLPHFGESARHLFEDVRLGMEDLSVAAVRHHTATIAHRLVVDFFEHKKTCGYLCVARCVADHCRVTGQIWNPGGRWFFSRDDRQVYCSTACQSTARSHRFRSPHHISAQR